MYVVLLLKNVLKSEEIQQLQPYLTSGPRSHLKLKQHYVSNYHHINIWSLEWIIIIRLSIHFD